MIKVFQLGRRIDWLDAFSLITLLALAGCAGQVFQPDSTSTSAAPAVATLPSVPEATTAVEPSYMVLDADAGQYKEQQLALPSEDIEIEASTSLERYNDSPRWPPAAYFSFRDGPVSKGNIVQLSMSRYHEDKTQLGVAYRVFIAGKQTRFVGLEQVPLGYVMQVRFTFHHGLMTIYFEDFPPIEIQTGFASVTPYAQVSSGGAAFEVTSLKRGTQGR